ncbi:MAG TPA: GxxExxY protein [Spirochaetota bacterium]|nr:GxxExxY protein [Spirochaetota bacterium]
MVLSYPFSFDCIIRAAMNVYNEPGYGFLEKVYHRALCLELKAKQIPFETEKKITVSYKGTNVGDYYLDLFVADKIIVELKSSPGIITYHIRQVKNYLRAQNVPTGLLFNFTPHTLEWKKIFNPDS